MLSPDIGQSSRHHLQSGHVTNASVTISKTNTCHSINSQCSQGEVPHRLVIGGTQECLVMWSHAGLQMGRDWQQWPCMVMNLSGYSLPCHNLQDTGPSQIINPGWSSLINFWRKCVWTKKTSEEHKSMAHVWYVFGLNMNVYLYLLIHFSHWGSRAGLLFNDVWSVARACQNKVVLGDDGFWSDI